MISILVIQTNQAHCLRFENSQSFFLRKKLILHMRLWRLICYFMAPAEAKVMLWSHDILYHPETLVFELSRLG